MLSINDYNHLILLYDKFFKFNAHLKNLILSDDWDSVQVAVEEKEALIRQIIFFEKPRIESIKNNKEIMDLRNQLIELEKKNIELVKIKRQEMISELSTVSKAKKVLNAYAPSLNDNLSTFEIETEE